MKFVLSFISILAAVIAVPNAEAQVPRLDPIAVQMAQAISKSKQDSVIVFDFSGPGVKLNALGQRFGQDFSEDLAKANPSLHVLDRARISAQCAEHRLSLSALSDPSLAIWIAQDLGAKAVVLGKLINLDNNLDITIAAYSVRDARGIIGLKTTSSLSSEVRTLIGTEIPDISSLSTEPVYLPNKDVIGYPKCQHCPEAHYTEDAVKQQIEGTVTLEAIVGADGRAHNISVLKGLPFGLTRQAVIAVGSWMFKPAVDADGKPVAVRLVVEVTFRLR